MIEISIAAWSDAGQRREVNEDRVYYQILQSSDFDPISMCIVADGMGGHFAGEVASHWTVETLKRELADLFIPPDPRKTVQLTGDDMRAIAQETNKEVRPSEVILMRRLRAAVESANTAVHTYALHRPQEAMGAGSTLTMVFVKGKRAFVINVGDSRTYLLRQGRLTQLTKDHSVVAELVAAGHLTQEEAWEHPQAGLITRCLGYMGAVQVDIEPHTLESGDRLVLCSDGLWEMVRDPELVTRIIHTAPDLEAAVHRLIDAANHAGGKDNISVAILSIAEKPDIPT